MLKKSLALILVSILLISLVGCNKTETANNTPTNSTNNNTSEPAVKTGNELEGLLNINGKPISVVYLSNEVWSAWQTASTQYLKSLVERAGGKLQVFNPELDAQKQAQQVDDALILKPDIFVVKPVDSAAIVPALKKVNEAGIPIIALDVKPDEGVELLTHIQTNQYSLGALDAQFVSDKFKKLGKKAKVISIMGQLEVPIGRERQQGFNETAKKLGNIEILTEIEAKWDSTKAMNATLDALQRFPDANTIFVMADCMLSGVIEALKTQSKLFPVDDERHITIVSVDADPSGVKYLKEGYVDFIAEHNAALHSDIAAKVIIDYFHGKQIPKQIYFEPFGVTKDNVNDPNRWGNYDFKDINNWPVMKHDRYVMQTTK